MIELEELRAPAPETKTEPRPLSAEKDEDQTLTLGIETSCDETSVAVLSGSNKVLANVVSSSAALHKKYGGIVPEVASRAHVQAINPAIAEALRLADVTLWDMSVVAVTAGPGLIGSLAVGVAAAKSLAAVLEIPLIDVNHLEAHIYSNFLEHDDFKPPAVGLIVSGGHTLLVHMQDHGLYEVLGQTLDDAAGEALDKIGRYLGLGFPGGPAIEALASEGNPGAIDFPRALKNKGYDFSFSGPKTAVLQYVKRLRQQGRTPDIADICASFQEAVADVLATKTLRAAHDRAATRVFVCGGVAANKRLSDLLTEGSTRLGLKLYKPSPVYCTDNAAMVACCGFHRWARGITGDLDLIAADPNLPLA